MAARPKAPRAPGPNNGGAPTVNKRSLGFHEAIAALSPERRLAAEKDALWWLEWERAQETFWIQRFYLSLAIGNGTGFVFVATALKDAGDKVAIAKSVLPIAPHFFWGLVAAALIPATARLQRMNLAAYFHAVLLSAQGRADELATQFPNGRRRLGTYFEFASFLLMIGSAWNFFAGLRAALVSILTLALGHVPNAAELDTALNWKQLFGP